MDPNCCSEFKNSWSEEFLEDVLCDYIAVQCGIRGLSPNSIIKTYLPGIAYTLEMKKSIGQYIFRNIYTSREVKKVGNGFFRMYHEKCSDAERMKLPFGMDLALKARTVMKQSQQFSSSGDNAVMLRYRIFVALCLGIYFMLRCSEHIHSKKATAVKLTRRMFTFMDAKGSLIAYSQIGVVQAESVAINVPYGKTDKKGRGRRNRHIRQSDRYVCIVCILERWIKWTRDVYGAGEELGIYEVPSFKDLTKQELERVMQDTVTASGITNARNLTSHCLRYGGATMLAAAGFPHYLIAYYGGWSPDSGSLKLYTRPSDEMHKIVSAHMASMARKDSSRYFIQESHMINKRK